MILVVILILFITIVWYLISLDKKRNSRNYYVDYYHDYKKNSNHDVITEVNENIYFKKKLLSPTELNFYKKIKPLEQELDVIIIPQINLSEIIEKKGNKYHNELYRNIDFGIFSKSYDILLLIELNDHSHENYYRKKRDNKVKKICLSAGIKLITFYTYKTNEDNYVLNRIKETLKNINY